MTDKDLSAAKKVDLLLRQFRTSIDPNIPAQMLQTFMTVAMNEGKSLTEIAALCSSNISTASRHLLELGARNRRMEPGYGLVDRTTEPMNLRQNAYTLTAKGRLLLDAIIKIMEAEPSLRRSPAVENHSSSMLETDMPTYLVRLKANRELVGLFNADDPNDLWTYVDECCDISDCEYLPLPRGGMYHSGAGAPDVPTVWRDQPGTVEKMPDWFSGATMTDNWAEVFESEKGEKGWQDAPA